MSSDSSISKLREILSENGHVVFEQAKDGHETLRKIGSLKPDLTILEYDMPLLNGYEISRIALESKQCYIILMVTEVQKSIVESMNSEPEFVAMIKPINRAHLINTVDLMIKNMFKIRKLEQELEELKQTMNIRKDLEKAKGLLMSHFNLTEAEAFKRIQKQSMDKGIPMKEIAKAIILTYDV
ncbi:MAG: ANTAR domain-containing protein [Bacillota bacterium]|nr:ANTAR domain-containing protein [Bacillota bacterium]